jgi:DNA polymerase III epsilon subunit-like protein
MTKRICIIHTETTGLHEFKDEKVYKKNLFGYARLVAFDWIIVNKEKDTDYKIEKKEKFIIKPRCLNIPEEIVQFHGISQQIAIKKGKEIEDVLYKFQNDLNNIDVIVSHSLEFHLKAVQAELVRYNKPIDFNKFLLIDLNSFDHKIIPTTLPNLSLKLLNKKLEDKSLVLDTICELFFKLYKNYENEIKK